MVDGKFCSAIITETEAYAGVNDKASHAYGGKRTKRTEVMYAEGGVAYVYLCYGIHFLFNVVTNLKETPHAILIRGIQAENGEATILKRRGLKRFKSDSLSGPGKVSQALGINLLHNSIDLSGKLIWLEETNYKIQDEQLEITPRIGIEYAEEDAILPYRFLLKK